MNKNKVRFLNSFFLVTQLLCQPVQGGFLDLIGRFPEFLDKISSVKNLTELSSTNLEIRNLVQDYIVNHRQDLFDFSKIILTHDQFLDYFSQKSIGKLQGGLFNKIKKLKLRVDLLEDNFLSYLPVSLESLELINFNLNKKNAKDLLRLKNLTTLKLLCKRDNGITILSTQIIATLSKLSNITHFTLTRVNIGPKGAQIIANKMKNITHLHLDSNRLGPEGAASIARMSGITTLKLSWNDIGPEGAASIATMQGITTLDLNSNRIGYRGAASIARMSGITTLDLSSNDIQNKGAASIATMQGITTLNLSWNDIGSEGAASIARMRGIKELLLNKNPLESTGRAIIMAMEVPFLVLDE